MHNRICCVSYSQQLHLFTCIVLMTALSSNVQDDLRKDARLMEFNTLVNKVTIIIKQVQCNSYCDIQCLRKDRDSRQRRLYIRTYVSQFPPCISTFVMCIMMYKIVYWTLTLSHIVFTVLLVGYIKVTGIFTNNISERGNHGKTQAKIQHFGW